MRRRHLSLDPLTRKTESLARSDIGLGSDTGQAARISVLFCSPHDVSTRDAARMVIPKHRTRIGQSVSGSYIVDSTGWQKPVCRAWYAPVLAMIPFVSDQGDQPSIPGWKAQLVVTLACLTAAMSCSYIPRFTRKS